MNLSIFQVGHLLPLYIAKAERKGRTKVNFKTLLNEAPKLNPKRKEITKVIYEVRAEDVEDKIMCDELAKGKEGGNIFRIRSTV